ncbi:MAG: recombinase family protein [Patescibacteria group bacterium]|nr:recombinase family protein [Patescibacteria group bacterium]MDE2015842.1 recombinase family protein [Patescibacteria group bacterium]MDE2227217.1 recombinase family protein [Patescibacteria group bacterium]
MTIQTMGAKGPGAPAAIPAEIKVKYVLYARKSTEQDEKQALSIDSQVKEMLQIAERDGLEIVDIRRESHSAKDSGQRPVFNEIIKDLRSGRYTGILTWAPDRLSRNAGDLGSLVDLMDQKLLIEVRTFGQRFTNSPSEKFLLMILGAQGKLENDQKSVNVKRGLRMRCEMGLWPAPAPTGYLNEKRMDRKGHVLVDPERAPIVKQMFEKVAYEHWSGRKLYHWLKFDMNFRSVTSNKPLTLGNIYRLLETTFYYGVYEYPAGSGNWYTGKHQPLITREVYEKAQEWIKRDKIVRGESKEFAFTKLMTCGLCGSGITAEEKFKTLKTTGQTVRYVYYGCSRSKNLHCKNQYLREEELIKQLIEIIGQMDINETDIRKRFDEEMHRIGKFTKVFLGQKKAVQQEIEFNARSYATYVLNEGTPTEKRELLGMLKDKLVIANKVIKIVR